MNCPGGLLFQPAGVFLRVIKQRFTFGKNTAIAFNHCFCYDTTIKRIEVILWQMC